MSNDALTDKLQEEMDRATEGIQTTIEHLMFPVHAAQLKDFVALRYDLSSGAVGMAFMRLMVEEAPELKTCPGTDWVLPL